MRKILQFLATDGAFLYEERNCRIVDSVYVRAFGGTGSVTLCNDVVELRLWLERDRLFMDIRAVGCKCSDSWYSMDIVRQLLTGEVTDKALMDRENIIFVQQHFDKIQNLFSRLNIATTDSACKKLEKQRSERMFG